MRLAVSSNEITVLLEASEEESGAWTRRMKVTKEVATIGETIGSKTTPGVLMARLS